MKPFLSLFVCLFFGITTFAQEGDYKIVRDSISKLSCKPQDSIAVVQNNLELLSIDTNLYDRNLHLYYHDLGWSYYRLYLFTKDTTLIRQATVCYEKANSHNPGDAINFWQLAFLNLILGDCETGQFYIEKYKALTPKENRKEDQIKIMTRACGD